MYSRPVGGYGGGGGGQATVLPMASLGTTGVTVGGRPFRR
jgi:hypothetical protein